MTRAHDKKHVYLEPEKMARVVDRFVAGEKLSALAAENGVALSTISRQTKARGKPSRVMVANCCPHCKRKLVE